MNRYKLVPYCGGPYEQLERSEYGDWVRYEDVKPILAAAADGINAKFFRDALHYWLKRIPLATLREDERDQFDKDQRALYLASPDKVEWQPINSAPKDGRPVRLKWQGTTVEATGRWDQTPPRLSSVSLDADVARRRRG